MSIRKPAVAGRFYPEHPAILRTTIEKHLSAAEVQPSPASVAAVIAPHAGYPYSGLTAAHAFGRLRGKSPRRVVLLGCSHQFRFEGPSIYARGGYQTPLGVVGIDEDMAAQLVDAFGNNCPKAHQNEHALEVQVPFLQVVLPEGFTLVPVLFGSVPGTVHQDFGAALAGYLEPDDLVLASTDLSHFLTESEANTMDRRSLNKVLSRNEGALTDGAAKGRCALCGASAVVAAMAYANARQATQWHLLDYRTSAWASGDTTRVVGYGAVSMEREVA